MKIFISVVTVSLISGLAYAEEGNPASEAISAVTVAAVTEATDEAVIAAAESEVIKQISEKSEAEIPVLKTVTEKHAERKPISTSRVGLSIGLVLSALLGFYMFLRKVLKKSPLAKNSQIKVLTQHYLGPKKSLAIIRVAGESMLIGVTDQSINLIKTLALLDEEIPQETPRNFEKSFSEMIKKDQPNQPENFEEEKEDFSISKIKDFVSSRLKNMKEI